MKCIILAAGEGKRMHPLTLTRPKVMLPIANKPILEWNLLNAIDAGISEFIFVIGYRSEMVRNYFSKGEKWNVKIEYVNQGKALGTAHAVSMVESFVDDCIVMCGDTIFGSKDIKKLLKKDLAIGLLEFERPEQYGIVKIKDNKIQKIYEKMNKPFTNLINSGIYRFDHAIFDMIEKTKKSPRGEFEITDSINMLAQNEEVEAIFLEKWRDVVYPWDLLDANKEFIEKNNNKNLGKVEKNVNLKGHVIIGKNTKIYSGSYIEGPVIIGNSSKIGPNCYIRPYTAIGDRCHIGNACEIKNSIIMNDSNAPHLNYIGDSIIGENCNLGAGTKVANLRFDKKNIYATLNGKKIDTNRRKLGMIMGDFCQTGINTSINVGSMIGNNVMIGPQSIVSKELASNVKIK